MLAGQARRSECESPEPWRQSVNICYPSTAVGTWEADTESLSMPLGQLIWLTEWENNEGTLSQTSRVAATGNHGCSLTSTRAMWHTHTYSHTHTYTHTIIKPQLSRQLSIWHEDSSESTGKFQIDEPQVWPADLCQRRKGNGEGTGFSNR